MTPEHNGGQLDAVRLMINEHENTVSPNRKQNLPESQPESQASQAKTESRNRCVPTSGALAFSVKALWDVLRFVKVQWDHKRFTNIGEEKLVKELKVIERGTKTVQGFICNRFVVSIIDWAEPFVQTSDHPVLMDRVHRNAVDRSGLLLTLFIHSQVDYLEL